MKKKTLLKLALCTLAFLLPTGAWADDPVTISSTAVCSFASVTTDPEDITSITNYNSTGFYIRGNNTNATKLQIRYTPQTKISFSLGDGTTLTDLVSFLTLKNQTKNSYTTSSTVNADYSETNRLNFAFKTTVAGTLYVAFRSNQDYSSAENNPLLRMYFTDGTTVTSSTKSLKDVSDTENYPNRCDVLTYTTTVGGSFFLDGYNGAVDIYYVKFVPAYSLTITAENGSVAESGATPVTTSEGVNYYASGTEVTLTATADDGYVFTSWTVDGVADGNTNPRTIMMSANKTVVANFQAKYLLTTTCNPTVGGSITPSVQSGQSLGENYYLTGSVVRLSASANSGYEFVKWSTQETTSSINVTMNEAKTITAYFRKVSLDATTIWNFNQYMGTENVVIGSGTKGVFDFNGLFVHWDGSRRFKDKVPTDGLPMTIFNTNVTSTVPTLTDVDAADPDIAVTAFAYKTPSAGTLRVKVYVSVSGRDIDIYADGTKQNYSLGEDAASSSHTYTEKTNYILSYSAASGKTLYIVPRGGAIYFKEISFVPTPPAAGVTKTVNISAAGYATFCAPQNYRWSTSTYDNLNAYIVSRTPTTTYATLSPIDADKDGYITIPACTGVVLKGPAGNYILTSVETATSVGTNLLKANLASYVLPYGDGTKGYNYTLASGPTFKHPNDDDATALAAGKAFLRTTVNAPKETTARGFDLVFEDEGTTGINEVRNQKSDGEFYNLSGQRVVNPAKGLYIVNGKKVVIK